MNAKLLYYKEERREREREEKNQLENKLQQIQLRK